MEHRDDIDGLRAIAVAAVVLFHLQIGHWTSGGFVGVDIFFVISGYLITDIIVRGLADESFSLIDFYRRRIYRIFPALFTVLAACMAASWALDYGSETQSTIKSLIASIFFISNIYFYTTSGYFSSEAESAPLLHTWSLSVEEQFYLLFPLLMIGLSLRTAHVRRMAILALAVLSFGYACWTVERDPAAAFYLLPSRAWELLSGAVLALRILPPVKTIRFAETISALGLILVLGSIASIDRSMPFPGALAAIPCLGTAAILYGGALPTRVGRVLGLAPLRYLGLISYSLYLWHWPILVFYRRIDVPHDVEKLLLAATCVAVAALSYHGIERPFRRLGRSGAHPAFATAAAAMVAYTLVGLGTVKVAPILKTSPEGVDSVLSFVNYEMSETVREGSCFLTERRGGFAGFAPETCLHWDADRRNVMLIGDSYGAHLWPGFKAANADVNFLQATASLCKPVLPAQGSTRCRDLLIYVTETFLARHRPDEIVLAARWRAEDLEALRYTIDVLRRFTDRIVVIGPIVEYEQSLPRLLARQIQSNGRKRADHQRSSAPQRADDVLARGLAGSPATYVSLIALLCTPDCIVWASPGEPMQFDFGHLTSAGSDVVALRLDPALFQALP